MVTEQEKERVKNTGVGQISHSSDEESQRRIATIKASWLLLGYVAPYTFIYIKKQRMKAKEGLAAL